MKLRYVLILIIFILITSCVGIHKPTSYIHLPEYGYLPIIDKGNYRLIMSQYVGYDWYEKSDFSSRDTHGNIGFSERDALPTSKEEAISIVENNLSFKYKRRNSGEIKKEIITAPLMLIYWAPGIAIISEYFAHKSNPEHGTQGKEASNIADVNSHKNVPDIVSEIAHILITDEQNKGIPNVETLLLMMPIPYKAYADETGHRTFPKTNTRQFYISDKLAKMLAESIGEEGITLKGKSTDINGFVWHEVYYDKVKYNEVQEDLSVLILIKGKGYQSKFVKIPMSEFLGKDGNHHITLRKAQKEAPKNSMNPWLVSKRLQQYVDYYSRKYKSITFSEDRLDNPLLPFEEFEELVLAAAKVAPDYPLVNTAMFYYEVELGHLEKAKEYHQYIQDDRYVKAIYDIIWQDGLPMWY